MTSIVSVLYLQNIVVETCHPERFERCFDSLVESRPVKSNLGLSQQQNHLFVEIRITDGTFQSISITKEILGKVLREIEFRFFYASKAKHQKQNFEMCSNLYI